MKFPVSVIILLSVSFAFGQKTTEDVSESLKQTIKSEFDRLQRSPGTKIDPKQLPDQTAEFQRRFLTFNVTGEIGFKDITLTGLTNLRVLENAFKVKTQFGNTELKVAMAIGPLVLKGRAIASLMGVGPKVSFEGKLVHVDAAAVLSYHPPLEQVYVKSFTLGELSGLKLSLNGPGIITPFFANQFIRAGLATFKPVIKSVVERQSRAVLEKTVLDSDFIKSVIKDLREE